MAKKIYEESNIAAIAEAIREKTGTEATYTTAEMRGGIGKVYDAGFAAGQATGGDTDAAYQEGYDAGEKAEYDRFWDAYQENGNRTDYSHMFSTGWTNDIFKPKYDIRPTNAYMMFRYSRVAINCDLVEHLNNLGVALDFKNCQNAQYAFFNIYTNHLGVIDLSNATNVDSIFSYSSSLIAIDKIISRERTKWSTNAFSGCSQLTNVRFEGVIARSIVFGACPLSRASIMSVIDALADNTTGFTATFKQTAVNAAFSESQWETLIATKPNWTITLA